MMYDSPDFPFKDFTESLDLEDRFDTDNLLFTSETTSIITTVGNGVKDPLQISREILSPVKNNLLLTPNESGTLFTIDDESFSNLNKIQNCHDDNTAINFVHADTSYYDESTLLDDNTVDQFLLPTQTSSNSLEDCTNKGPDILALFSCVICHDIFTTDADLLDHTILMHASVNLFNSENIVPTSTHSEQEDMEQLFGLTIELENSTKLIFKGSSNLSTNFDAEWLVCCICERILSMVLEAEPNEQLVCCVDVNGKGCVGSRKLSAMFVCDVCNYLFGDGEALDRHKLTCIGNKENVLIEEFEEFSIETTNSQHHDLASTICGKDFPTELEMKTHEERNRGNRTRRPYKPSANNKMWNCGSCNQLFATARELYRHKRGEDRPPGTLLMAYVCEECDKVLGSMCALHTHKKMHKVSKPGYPCRICSRRFNQSGHLAIHMRMHTGERPYPCDLCSKAFKVKVERDDHRRTHTGERPFACSACPKTFTAAARLREHARIHTDQRPYICDICGAAFRRPYARTVHTLIHTGQKPHECDVCGTAFRRSGDMWKHKRTLHGIQPTDVEAK